MNKILVVEDDWDINGLLYNILEQNGYEVKAAYSGSEAKMCLEQGKFDLLLLDLMLPGIKGEDLIDEIRKSSIIPIIVISAKSAQEDKINVLKIGADDFISKPFDINEVIAEINKCSGLLIGSPTLLADTLPPIWTILGSLNPVIHRGLHASCFGSYGWSGDALKNIEQRFNQLKFNIPVAPLGVMFRPSEDELEKAFAFGHDFAKETLQCVNGGQCNIQAQ